MAKQKTTWAIRHWNGEFYADTVRPTRSESIDVFRGHYGISEKDWRTDVMCGVHRAVKVTLVETR